jgi:hypothetical protein
VLLKTVFIGNACHPNYTHQVKVESTQACAQPILELAIQLVTQKCGCPTTPVDLMCNDPECETLINDRDLF